MITYHMRKDDILCVILSLNSLICRCGKKYNLGKVKMIVLPLFTAGGTNKRGINYGGKNENERRDPARQFDS